jgi:hypothetical protein
MRSILVPFPLEWFGTSVRRARPSRSQSSRKEFRSCTFDTHIAKRPFNRWDTGFPSIMVCSHRLGGMVGAEESNTLGATVRFDAVFNVAIMCSAFVGLSATVPSTTRFVSSRLRFSLRTRKSGYLLDTGRVSLWPEQTRSEHTRDWHSFRHVRLGAPDYRSVPTRQDPSSSSIL